MAFFHIPREILYRFSVLYSSAVSGYGALMHERYQS